MAPQLISSNQQQQYLYESFYSAPTSPLENACQPTFDHHHHETEQSELPATSKRFTYDDNYYYDDYYDEDADNNFVEFEFETSRRFFISDDEEIVQPQRKESLPAMASADELFCDGKVMPLKPPPPHRKGSSSPRSPSTSLRFPFSRQSLWNDDFDPFMVALENVKDENIESIRKEGKRDHRGTRSSSAIKCISFRHHPPQTCRTEPEEGNRSMWVHYKNRKMEKVEKKTTSTTTKLAEPKGMSFARHARMVKMGRQQHTNGGKESEESCKNGESKREKIRKFLIKSASTGGRAGNDEEFKQKEGAPNEAFPPSNKRGFTRKFSFMSTARGGNNGIEEEEKRVSHHQVTKITLVQYRLPSLFVCMGYGSKYVK